MITLKLTLSEATELYGAINEILQNQLPFQLSWTLDDINESLEKHAKRFEDTRTKIVQKYSKGEPVPGENGTVSYELANPQEFNKEFLEMAGTEIQVEIEQSITKEELVQVPDLKVSGAALKLIKKHLINTEKKEPQENEEKES